MTKLSRVLATAAMLGLATGPAFADLVTKTWVSSTTGNDTGGCNFIAPCKTFAYAVAQTAPGGELVVKDAGSYGPVTITRAISIVSEDLLAAISVPQGMTGITVNAGDNDKVILQGLVIDGHGLGRDGIDFLRGASLTVQNCHVRNFTNDGISFFASFPYNIYYNIMDTEVAHAGYAAIIIYSGNGMLSRVNLHDSFYGLYVVNSNAALIDSTINANSEGIEADTQGNILIGQTTLVANYNAFHLTGGTIGSYGDNYISANLAREESALSSLQRK